MAEIYSYFKERIVMAFEHIKKNMMKLIVIFVVIRIGVAFFHCFFELDNPHTWRQVDTLGVAMRYWMQWTIEGRATLLPAVLNSGDTSGIMPMEFPFLNVVLAPLFAFGPWYGRYLACFATVLLHTSLVLANIRIWKNHSLLSGNPRAFLLVPIVGVGAIYISRVIPDFLATSLVFLGIGLTWKPVGRVRFTIAILTCMLGVLIKPISVVMFALFLLHPEFAVWRGINRVSLMACAKKGVFVICSMIPCIIYYTLGLTYLKGLQETNGRFGIEREGPIQNLLSLTTLSIHDVVSFLADTFFFDASIFMMLPLFTMLVIQKKFHAFRLLFVLILQIIACFAIDGKHAVVHTYYFLSTLPICCLLFWEITASAYYQFENSRGKIRVLYVCLILVNALGFLISFSQRLLFDIRTALPSFAPRIAVLDSECKLLKSHNKDVPWKSAYVFRTAWTPYPYIGLCLGEREYSTTSEWGVFSTNQLIPFGCTIVDKTRSLTLVRCKSK